MSELEDGAKLLEYVLSKLPIFMFTSMLVEFHE